MKKIALLLSFLVCNSGCVPLVAVGTAASVIMLSDNRQMSTVVSDQVLEMKVRHYLTDKDYYDKNNINVIAYNNSLLLVGQVKSSALKEQVNKQLSEHFMSHKVYNELQVGHATSYATRLNDSWITSKIKSLITMNTRIDPLKVKVVTENSTVYLAGILDNESALEITKVARTTRGVKEVIRLFDYV